MSNTLDHNFKVNPHLDAGLGPAVSFTRSTIAYVQQRDFRTNNTRVGSGVELVANEPRFPGAMYVRNELLQTGDLTNAAWTQNNIGIPAQNATDSQGNANSAWTITDTNDGGPLAHCVMQEITFDRRLKVSCEIEVKGGTQRYVLFSMNDPANFAGAESGIFDTLTGEWVYAATLDDNNRNLDVISRERLADGWWRISLTGLVTGTINDNFAVGPANGPTQADATYQGDGTGTILVAYPMKRNISNVRDNLPRTYVESGAINGIARLNAGNLQNAAPNSMMYGAIANNGLPDGGYYNYEWIWLHETGFAEGVKARNKVQPDVYFSATDQGGPEAAHIICNNQRQVMQDYVYYSGFPSAHQRYVFKLTISDVTVVPEGPVAQLDISFGLILQNYYVSDFDENGQLEIPFDLGTFFVSVNFGIGILGPDTGDVTFEHPHLILDDGNLTYKPTDGIDYGAARNEWRDTIGQGKIDGLLIEREKENLVLDSNDLDTINWTKAPSITAGRDWYSIMSNEFACPLIKVPNDPQNSGPAWVEQAVTMVAGETYTLSFFLTFSTYTHFDVGIVNNGAQDLVNRVLQGDVAVDEVYPLNRVTDGADIVRTLVKTGPFWEWWHAMTFVCDGADPTADLRFQPLNNSDLPTLPFNNRAAMVLSEIQLEQGDVTSYYPTGTRGAEVAQITDMSWFNASAGTFMVQFIVPNVTDLTVPRCILSAHNGGPPQRISIDLGNGANDLIRMQVHNVSQQVNIAGPSLTPGSICSVAIAYSANDFEMWVNGELAGTSGSGAVPSGIDTLNIGSNHADVEQIDESIARVWYDDTRLPSADLESLSTGRLPSTTQGLSRDLGRPVERIRDLSL